jgi:hypothetical protein
MIYSTLSIVLISIAGCLFSAPQHGLSESFDSDLIASVTDPGTFGCDDAAIAFATIDRQCGAGHHGDRSTNLRALAIFNLADVCWYCKLTPEHCKGIRGRISGASFSDEERAAIVALIAHLSDNDITTD